MARFRVSGKKRQDPPQGHGQRGRVLRIIVCALMGLALVLPALFVNKIMGYLPVFAYLFAILFSFLYLRLLSRGLGFEQVGVGRSCMRGEMVKFELVVRNDSVMPAVRVDTLFYISDAVGGPGQTMTRSITIPPRSTKRFEFAVRFDHIGGYEVGIREADVCDLLSLSRKTVMNGRLQKVSVAPRIYDPATLEVSDDAAVEAKTTVRSVINEGMDYAGVREYRWGDPIKTIHWKLSAGTPLGDYYTRLYETATNPGVAVIADLQAPSYGTEELMDVYDAVVESAFSIERYAAEVGMESELLFVDALGAHRRFAGPLQGRYGEIIERMPGISVGDGSAALDMLSEEAASIYGQSNLVICTASVTDELVASMLAIRAGHRSPLLFAIVPPGLDEEERGRLLAPLRRLRGTGIYFAVLERAEELEKDGGAYA